MFQLAYQQSHLNIPNVEKLEQLFQKHKELLITKHLSVADSNHGSLNHIKKPSYNLHWEQKNKLSSQSVSHVGGNKEEIID